MLKTFFLNSTLAYYGEEEFNYIQKFLLQQGILNTQGADYNDFIDMQVVQHGAGDMSVDVKIGTAVIDTTRSSVDFKVFVSNLALANLVITPNTSGLNRVDAVILKLSQTIVPNALMSNVSTLEVVPGDGATALSDGDIQTAIGATYDFIRLANITVSNGETAILTADIADTRVRCYNTDATVPNPTIIKFRQLTADPTTPVEGEMWYNTTDNLLRYYDGVAVVNIQASTYTGGAGITISGAGDVSLDTEDNEKFIDPNNVITQVAGYLVGGSSHSALGVFQSLFSGANNGKIKINVDGTEHDNVAVDLYSLSAVNVGNGSQVSSNALPGGMSFTASNAGIIKLTSLHWKSWEGGYSVQATLRTGSVIGSGSVVAVAPLRATIADNTEYDEVFPTTINLVDGQAYNIYLTADSVGCYRVASGQLWSILNGYVRVAVSSLAEVASRVQDGIRVATGKDDVVIYDTNHFKITSSHAGRTSSILKLMTPTTGTDISGDGATPYLDCADNATETQGLGDDYKAVVLDKDGNLFLEILEKAYRKTTADLNVLLLELFSLYASETLKTSSDAVVASGASEADFVKRKEIQFNYFVSGTIRVKYQIRENNTTAVATFQLRKNGVVLYEDTQNSTTFAQKTYDIPVVRGDLIQIYIKNTSSYAGEVQQFRLYYDFANRYTTADTVIV